MLPNTFPSTRDSGIEVIELQLTKWVVEFICELNGWLYSRHLLSVFFNYMNNKGITENVGDLQYNCTSDNSTVTVEQAVSVSAISSRFASLSCCYIFINRYTV